MRVLDSGAGYGKIICPRSKVIRPNRAAPSAVRTERGRHRKLRAFRWLRPINRRRLGGAELAQHARDHRTRETRGGRRRSGGSVFAQRVDRAMHVAGARNDNSSSRRRFIRDRPIAVPRATQRYRLPEVLPRRLMANISDGLGLEGRCAFDARPLFHAVGAINNNVDERRRLADFSGTSSPSAFPVTSLAG